MIFSFFSIFATFDAKPSQALKNQLCDNFKQDKTTLISFSALDVLPKDLHAEIFTYLCVPTHYNQSHFEHEDVSFLVKNLYVVAEEISIFAEFQIPITLNVSQFSQLQNCYLNIIRSDNANNAVLEDYTIEKTPNQNINFYLIDSEPASELLTEAFCLDNTSKNIHNYFQEKNDNIELKTILIKIKQLISYKFLGKIIKDTSLERCFCKQLTAA